MSKKKIILEYPLNYASENILWIMIGSELGLSEWFSDGVTVEDDLYTFSWDNHYQSAHLIGKKEGKRIRFQWEEDKETDAFFEMEIVTQNLSGNVALQITEFCTPDEIEDLTLLWNKHVEALRRKVGVN
ncbi:MAG: START-like domain-containing protein [Paludibacteraceae bacterium]